jgi:hypothetical protein
MSWDRRARILRALCGIGLVVAVALCCRGYLRGILEFSSPIAMFACVVLLSALALAAVLSIRDYASTRLATVLGVLTLLFLGVAFRDLRQEAQHSECINRLCQIDCPLHCCVPLSMKLKEGDRMDPKIVAQYVKGNTIPKCPCGPEYEISWIVGGPSPRCPIHGGIPGNK